MTLPLEAITCLELFSQLENQPFTLHARRLTGLIPCRPQYYEFTGTVVCKYYQCVSSPNPSSELQAFVSSLPSSHHLLTNALEGLRCKPVLPEKNEMSGFSSTDMCLLCFLYLPNLKLPSSSDSGQQLQFLSHQVYQQILSCRMTIL